MMIALTFHDSIFEMCDSGHDLYHFGIKAFVHFNVSGLKEMLIRRRRSRLWHKELVP